jgi:hypothetical protein
MFSKIRYGTNLPVGRVPFKVLPSFKDFYGRTKVTFAREQREDRCALDGVSIFSIQALYIFFSTYK